MIFSLKNIIKNILSIAMLSIFYLPLAHTIEQKEIQTKGSILREHDKPLISKRVVKLISNENILFMTAGGATALLAPFVCLISFIYCLSQFDK